MTDEYADLEAEGQTTMFPRETLQDPTPEQAAVTAADMRAALRERYKPDCWALMFEVRNRTGWAPSKRAVAINGHGEGARYLDALAISLYESARPGDSGYRLLGFEIKVSRSDWLAELRDPTKAGAFAGKFRAFWIGAPRGVVKPAELLLDGGGLPELYPSGLRQRRPATRTTPTITPAWLSCIMARMVRGSAADTGEP